MNFKDHFVLWEWKTAKEKKRLNQEIRKVLKGYVKYNNLKQDEDIF